MSRPRRPEETPNSAAHRGRPGPVRRIARTLAEVAAEFGVAERTAASWRAKGMPGDPGEYDLDEIAEWREAFHAEALDETSDLAALQRRKLQLEIEKREIDLARARNQVVDVGVIRSAILPHLYTVRSLLEQLPDRLVVAIADPKALRKAAEEAIADVCRVIAEGAEELGRLAEAGEDADDSAERDGDDGDDGPGESDGRVEEP